MHVVKCDNTEQRNLVLFIDWKVKHWANIMFYVQESGATKGGSSL